MSSLKDDIDAPMLKTIMCLNLLKIRTLWSCCGFDYPEQPAHKTHQECLNISMVFSDLSASVGIRVIQSNPLWRLKTQPVVGDNKALILFLGEARSDTNWVKGTAHHHEIPAQMLYGLERQLYGMKDHFIEEVTLVDTNAEAKKVTPYWTYVAREPWVIRKADL